MLKLKFLIDDFYLLVYTLNYNGKNKSSDKFIDDIVNLQDRVWEISEEIFDFFTNRFFPEGVLNYDLEELTIKCKEILLQIYKLKEFKVIKKQTEEYKNGIESEWINNLDRTLKFMEDLTGLKFEKYFRVYITHPSLKN